MSSLFGSTISMMSWRRVVLMSSLCFLATASVSRAAEPVERHVRQAHDRPNILVVMVDDMGFSDLGCYGSEIETPVLDGLGPCARGGSAGNGDQVASSRISKVLAMEEPTPRWSASRRQRDPGPHPEDGQKQSVGSAEDPRRAAEAGTGDL